MNKTNNNDYINKIRLINELRLEKPDIEITIKDKGKVVYQGKSFAGCFVSVEGITSLEHVHHPEDLVIDGVTQKLTWGHPLITGYAWDQFVKSDMLSVLRKSAEFVLTNLKKLDRFYAINHPIQKGNHAGSN